jgi:hypothetical protein
VTPTRDAAYLAFVRQQPCLFCQTGPSQAHHAGKAGAGGGTSLKGCDRHTVPLCGVHHGEFHQRGRIGFWTGERTRGKFDTAIGRLNARWDQSHGKSNEETAPGT